LPLNICIPVLGIMIITNLKNNIWNKNHQLSETLRMYYTYFQSNEKITRHFRLHLKIIKERRERENLDKKILSQKVIFFHLCSNGNVFKK